MQVEVACSSKVDRDDDDFTYLCRICAVKTHNIIPMFGKEDDDQNLVEKINKYLPIKVCNDDLLPAGVCEQCSNAVLAWHELVECCVQADVSFRNRLTLSQKQRIPPPTPSVLANSDVPLDENGMKWTGGRYLCEEFDECRTGCDAESAPPPTPNDCVSDDEPLSRVAAAGHTLSAYDSFYAALVKFRNHFVAQHRESSVEFTESSTEEETELLEVDEYDDLSKSNMRRDRMDERTRAELNEVQAKMNGKVYYGCRVCGKKLSSAHTYLFHKNIHTGERPCVCHVCGKTFRAPSGLQRHLKETHERLKRYVCALCAKTFVNSQNLRQHMRIHTGERPYVCAQCGKRFTQSGSLHVHLKTHSDHFPFCCTECGARFRLRSGLSKHKLKHTGERPHVCVSCGKGFRQKHELNSHSLTHSNSKPFSCGLCGAAFRQRRALRHHCKRLHESREADDVSERRPRYLVHVVPAPAYSATGLIQTSAETTESGDACLLTERPPLHSDIGAIFSAESDPNRIRFLKEQFAHTHLANWVHFSKENDNPEKKRETHYNAFVELRSNNSEDSEHNVGSRVATEFSLHNLDTPTETANNGTPQRSVDNSDSPNRVEAVPTNKEQNEFSDHSDTESFARLSESVFEAIEDTQDGTFEKHSTDESLSPAKPKKSKQTRTCPICGKTYTASSSYFYHMKHFHGRSKEHGCDVCGKKFGTRGDLEQHAAVHTDECKYACRSCDKKFRSRASWYIHEQIHEGVKNYQCSTCDKRFRWRTHLQRHSSRHAAEKQHRCALCGRGFSVHCDLLRHARTHAGGSFDCDTCHAKFAQVRYLKAHIRKKHGAPKDTG